MIQQNFKMHILPSASTFVINDLNSTLPFDINTMIQKYSLYTTGCNLAKFNGVFSADNPQSESSLANLPVTSVCVDGVTFSLNDPSLLLPTHLAQTKALIHQLWNLMGREESSFSDSKQLFSYIKQSATMQWNVRQMFEYKLGPLSMIILRPGLYDQEGTELFLLATRNEKKSSDQNSRGSRDSWKLDCVATYQQLKDVFGNIHSLVFPEDIRKQEEPEQDTRDVPFEQLKLQLQLELNPCELGFEDVDTSPFVNCKKLNVKQSQKKDGRQCTGSLPQRWRIFNALKEHWLSADFVPVVFNKKYSTQIEWKVFVTVDNYSMGLSIRYNERCGRWQLQNVVDCEAYRVWSQYLLLGSLRTTALARGNIDGQSRMWTEDDFKKLVH